jgi:hypothetical protein
LFLCDALGVFSYTITNVTWVDIFDGFAEGHPIGMGFAHFAFQDVGEVIANLPDACRCLLELRALC